MAKAGGRRGLVCTECGAIAPADADRWRVYLTADEDESAELAIYCRACAAVEFGD